MTGRAAGVVLVGGSVVLADEIVEAQVRFCDDHITGIGPGLVIEGDRVVDASGLLVAPGFVDLQVNGAVGADVTTEPHRCHEVGVALARRGVTSWCPTVITAPAGTIERALDAVASLGPAPAGAASILGLHLEGPALSFERRGTHPGSALRSPAELDPDAWLDRAGAPVRIVTLAPELPGAGELLDQLVAAGVVVSVGHTAASAEAVEEAAARGASLVTHLFNGMTGLHHRDPGPVGVALTDERLRASLIVDGIHVDPRVIRLAWQALGPDRFVCVSDAVAALDGGMDGGMAGGAGLGHIGGLAVTVADGAVRNAEGNLAGSAIGLDDAVRNLVAFTGCSIPEAIGAASRVPADVLGLTDRGRLAPGAVADLVLLTPELEVVDTVVAGHLRPDALPVSSQHRSDTSTDGTH